MHLSSRFNTYGERILTAGWLLFLASFLLVSKSSIINFFLWGAVLLPLLFAARWTDLQQFHRSPLVNAWFALQIYLLCSFLWADHPEDVEFMRFFKRFAYLYGYFLATFIVFKATPGLDRQLLRWAPIAIACAAAVQMLWFYSHYSFPTERMPGPGKLWNPIHFGVAAAGFTLASMLRFSQQSMAFKVALIASALINCLAIYLCQSRGALLSIALVALLSALFSRRLLLITLGALACCLTIALVLDVNTLLERGLSLRPQIWSAQLARIQECNWLLGCGLGIDETVAITPKLRFNPHSIYLGWLLYGGVIGLMGYVVFLIALIRSGIREEMPEWTLLVFMGITSTLTAGDHVFITPSPYWIVLLIPIAILLGKIAATKPSFTDLRCAA